MMNKNEKLFMLFCILFFIVFSIVGLITSIKTTDTIMIIMWSIDLGVWIFGFVKVIIVLMASTKDKKK